jgi:Tir chaperone protein (CesT) family
MPSIPDAVLDSFSRGMRDLDDSQAYMIQVAEDIEVHVQAEAGERILLLAMLALDFNQLGDDQLQALLALNQPGDAYPLLTVSIDPGSGQLTVWTSVEANDNDSVQFTSTFDRLVCRARGIMSLLHSGLYGQAATRAFPLNIGRPS